MQGENSQKLCPNQTLFTKMIGGLDLASGCSGLRPLTLEECDPWQTRSEGAQ